MSTREYHRHDDGSVVLGEALRCIDPDAGSVDVIVLDDPAKVGALAASKAEALRSQAEFFLSIDMPIAADHCVEAAVAWESPAPITNGHVVSDSEECWCEPTVAKVAGKS